MKSKRSVNSQSEKLQIEDGQQQQQNNQSSESDILPKNKTNASKIIIAFLLMLILFLLIIILFQSKSNSISQLVQSQKASAYDADQSSQYKNEITNTNTNTNQTIKKQVKRILKDYEQQNKYTVAIHSVGIMRENIPFLRQFIAYHANIGIDKFYIYDNSGSVGQYGASQKQNRQGFNYKEVMPYSDQQIQAQVDSIVKQFQGQVFVIKWQPKDENGNIVMQQMDAMYQYIKEYGKLSDYTLFIDLDEYLFSPQDRNLKQYLRDKQKLGFDQFQILQKKFAYRYCMQDKRVLQIYDCIQISNYEKHKAWARKNIVKNKLMIDEVPYTPHDINIDGNSMWVPMQEFRFNHYNTNQINGNWVVQHYDKSEYKICFDTGMLRYEEYLSSICESQGKCNTKNLKPIFKDKNKQKQICRHSLFDYSKI